MIKHAVPWDPYNCEGPPSAGIPPTTENRSMRDAHTVVMFSLDATLLID